MILYKSIHRYELNRTQIVMTEVIYYSATGNTKDVVETIVQVTGGNLFEIVTDAFGCKEYKPEVLFKDKKILNNIRNHPMAIWKMEQ